MSSTSRAFKKGIIASLPFLLMVGPFGMLFGVVATEAGMTVLQSMVMTSVVVAGAAQFSAVQILNDGQAFYIAVLTGLAVNMRMAMYSASIAKYVGEAPIYKRALLSYLMVDQTYALGVSKYEQEPDMSINEKLGYFYGTAFLIFPTWFITSYIGIIVGAAIPPEYALDFAIPVAFLAIVAPNLRSIPHIVAAVVSVIIALILQDIPYNLWLMIAAVIAMIAGAQTEKWLEARK